MSKTDSDLLTEDSRQDAPGALTMEKAAGGARAGQSLERVSVIIPVKNEEASIEALLRALAAQSLRPSEIVVTDAGSEDRTRDIIRRFQSESTLPVVLIEVEHAFPGRGRNLAIERAAHEWIASIDGGNVPGADWLLELTATARTHPEARVIYGRFEPVTDTYFTECAAIAYVPPPTPTTRFIASSLLHRSAWETAGRFREDLRSGEDLLFFRAIDDARIPVAYSPKASVRWSLQPSLAGTFRRFATYSRYGMKAGLAHNWQFSVSRLYVVLLATAAAGLLWWWPLVALVPLVLLLRAERRIQRWFDVQDPSRRTREMLDPRRAAAVAGIAVMIDAAMFRGMWTWFRNDYFKDRRG